MTVKRIGIIGALDGEVESLISKLEEREEILAGGILFHRGRLLGKEIIVAKCGVGKVFAAMCAEAMIIRFSPDLVVNTGVGGAIAKDIGVLDIIIAERLVQHDMDTSPLGDPKGLISGINKIYFETDERAKELLLAAAEECGIKARGGTVASGDVFVASGEMKERIAADFGADACEMEGAAIAHVCFVNATPCVVIRAISDSADDSSSMDYMQFLPLAARNSSLITERLIERY